MKVDVAGPTTNRFVHFTAAGQAINVSLTGR